MEPGDQPNDPPLPPFLDLAGPTTARAAMPAGTDAPDPSGSEATESKPERTVPLLIPLPARGEAALAGLPITGITRKRLGWLLGACVAVWVLLLFVRQVGDASAAQARADHIERENAVLATRVEALARERDLVQQSAFVALEARGYGLGTTRERPFVLAPGAPSLPPDAPGSATLRVGHVEDAGTPLESWLEILFGPTPD
jgi:hypothetical protein